MKAKKQTAKYKMGKWYTLGAESSIEVRKRYKHLNFPDIYKFAIIHRKKSKPKEVKFVKSHLDASYMTGPYRTSKTFKFKTQADAEKKVKSIKKNIKKYCD